MISPLLSLPFATLLLCIALLPLVASHFWDSNRNKGIVSGVLLLPILGWLILNDLHALEHTLLEYFSFIVLLGSLYVIAGGIAVEGDVRATPVLNTLILALGAVLANFIGTTGASMVLIRPFLRMNESRKRISHLVFFFILIVSNAGGLLTPLGDPPLFLGYLRGVPFFWTLKLWPMWLFVVGALLFLFLFVDEHLNSKEFTAEEVVRGFSQLKKFKVRGRHNFIFLFGVILAIFQPTPWRELLMLAMGLASLTTGKKSVREYNQFNWHPILEVAILFVGIFITMVPTLMMLKTMAPTLGINEPWQFFWLTGFLSSFLDNAPTYATFFSLAQGLNLPASVVGIPDLILEAISAGAVLMGANSYIGNGPNFMVKAIADHRGFKTFSFFLYVFYAAVTLFPLYLLMTYIFFL